MRNITQRLVQSTAIIGSLTAGIMFVSVQAAEEKIPANKATGYVFDSATTVVRTGTNTCLHTINWTKDTAAEQCEPQLVAKKEAPAETAAAAPIAPPTPERVTDRIYLGADTYFQFNEATLTSEAETKLNRIAERARAAMEPSIKVTGYTDQIGSEEYNLELSQRRAEAVKSYLVNKQIPEESIEVSGQGEADPIVSCDGRQGRALIDCLSPNRRSEIEFSALTEVARP